MNTNKTQKICRQIQKVGLQIKREGLDNIFALAQDVFNDKDLSRNSRERLSEIMRQCTQAKLDLACMSRCIAGIVALQKEVA